MTPDSCGGLRLRQKYEPIHGSFLDNTNPKSAVLAYGDDRVVPLIQQTGSGTRYSAPEIDFWEHHGEGAVNTEKLKAHLQKTSSNRRANLSLVIL
jgi:uncharacterized protein